MPAGISSNHSLSGSSMRKFVLSEVAVFQYKCDEFYHPEADGGISILYNSLGIDWEIPKNKAILSNKDTKHPLLKDFDCSFVADSGWGV